MELRAVRGRPVIAVDTGERLGAVQDALVDPQQRRVVALRIRRGGRFRGDLADVPFEALHHLGPDAVTIPQHGALRPAGEAEQGHLRIDDLARLRVVTELGEARGRLDDVEFEPSSGLLTALVVVPPGIGGVLGRRQSVPIALVRAIGRDAVVLVASPAQVVEQRETSDDAAASGSGGPEEASGE
ncbi:MAG: PRC-barrel domain-containing protein [Thermomicrobium sp.]|nr:PRC-barrel domain-containing protein [Thermomicrobium sp.]MDW8059542.1 PRC-barrel domain-containing protein [Thermomicrobium sp.]